MPTIAPSIQSIVRSALVKSMTTGKATLVDASLADASDQIHVMDLVEEWDAHADGRTISGTTYTSLPFTVITNG